MMIFFHHMHYYSFTDVQTVVRTIQNHPNKELRQHVKIGAITTCIDPHNTFLTGYMTIPGIVNQCTPGWVNNVVLTSSTDAGVSYRAAPWLLFFKLFLQSILSSTPFWLTPLQCQTFLVF